MLRRFPLSTKFLLALGLAASLNACNGAASISANSNANSGSQNGQNGNSQGSSISFGSSGTRLINGSEVSFDVSPQMVQIEQVLVDGTKGLCSGVAIAPQYVLTAAHCFRPDVAESNLVSNGVSYPIDSIEVHPGFYTSNEVSAFFNDIAIIKSEKLNSATLSILVSVPVTAGAEMAIYGFGLDENDNYGVLKSGLNNVALVTENHIFSTPFDGKNVNACLGDSGAPAILGFTDKNGIFNVGIAGIVSSGTAPNCEKGDSTLFVNLQNKGIQDFIAEKAPGAVFN